MPYSPRHSIFQILARLFLCLIFITNFANAEKLPTRIYTIADGLSRDAINCIKQDSRGFMWFGTPEGLSRFDGYEFKNYQQEHGLPHRVIMEFLETRGGKIWIGTEKGLVLFNPNGSLPENIAKAAMPETVETGSRQEPMFTVYKLPGNDEQPPIYELFEDSSGTVWIGSLGLFRLDEENGETKIRAVDVSEGPNPKAPHIYSFAEDADGSLWIGTNNFLFKQKSDGTLEKYGKESGFPEGSINDIETQYPFTALLRDGENRIWVGTGFGLARLVKNPQPNQKIVERIFTEKDGLSGISMAKLFLSRDNKIWAMGGPGIEEYLPASDSFRKYTKENGLTEVGGASSMTEDKEGNLWVGQAGGAVKIARSGFTSFNASDGINYLTLASVFENKTGEIYLLADHLGEGKEPVYRFGDNKFTSVRVKAFSSLKNSGWGTSQVAFQDREGEWWFPTGEGLYRFPKVARIEDLADLKPKHIYTKRDGLPDNEIFRLFEDSRGDVWITTLYNSPSLSRWSRATDKIEIIPIEREKEFGGPSAFAEDSDGNIWMGSYQSRLIRFTNGKLKIFTTENGLPEGHLRGLHFDQKGRLWGATMQGGAFRVDDVLSDNPKISAITILDGLASNVVTTLTEDLQGRIYFATGRGVDRYEPETGRIKHYTTADGLASNHFTGALRDGNGNLWFATSNGVSRLIPEPERQFAPPPIFINGLRIADRNYPISELGETNLQDIELSPDRNQLEASFVSPNFSASGNLRYQYKLEGSDTDWREAADRRTVTFASLSAGNYRFLVRAVNSGGTVSENSAVISFKVLPPVWQRWWFLLLAAFAISGIVYLIYRYRLKQLLELEKVRTRIATDLHDDIGASLSKIAILSEVVHQRVAPVAPDDAEINEPLEEIAGTSRELVDSMSDIVWAINPERDHLSDLIQRMRNLAGEMTELADIGLRVHLSGIETDADLPLGADLRREIYLIFKETINNLVKHSACEMAEISFAIENDALIISVKDDGKGFSVPANGNGTSAAGTTRGGNGLPNIKRRAANLGGSYEISSEIGKGTTAVLRVPLQTGLRGFSLKSLYWKK